MSELSQYAIVYVDDETMALKYFERGFGQTFRVFTAPSAAKGWDIVQRHAPEIGVLMTDQRMPGQTGVELLEKIRHSYPYIIRILVTAYSDIDSAIAGVNDGAIYRYISKPWDVNDLRITLLRALEFFAVLKERDQLLREKLAVLQNILLSDKTKNLGVFAAGLGIYFRNTVDAVAQFIEAVPRDNPEPLAPESARVPLGRTIQNSIKKASEDIFQLSSSMKEVADPTSNRLFQAQGVESLLRGFVQKEQIALKAAPSLPNVGVNEKQLLKMLTLLVANVRATAEGSSAITLNIAPASGAGGVNGIRLSISDNLPNWTNRQRHRFFAPFSLIKDDANLGLGLAAAYFLAHHHGGRIEVKGNENLKVAVDLPLDPVSIPASLVDASQLKQIFSYERNWQDFLAPPT